jgi:transcriptional regulator with XRE-family HTH domain
MELFGKRLRERAKQLDLSDAEVARRAGLAERRYGHYVRGHREPDFRTLMRICAVLDLTPNDLLLSDAPARPTARERWMSRLFVAARALDVGGLRLAVRQIEALVAHQSADRKGKTRALGVRAGGC